MSNIAIIDLGTNTFHLLIAEPDTRPFHIIHRERLPVRIGVGGINNGLITPEGILRAVEAMRGFSLTIRKMGVTRVFAFGTSALRNAKNGNEVVSQIELATGIAVRIISGDEEAEYIYSGVRAALKMGSSTSLIVDIGGGSVEFILGNDHEIFWKQSFEVGAQRLLERFQKHDPILPDEVTEVNTYLSVALKPLDAAIRRFQPQTLIGSSGTFDTLSEMYHIHKGISYQPDSPETRLTIECFHQTFRALKNKNRAERLQIPGVIEMRVDMIVVACCLIKFLLDHHSFEAIRVSTYSLKEGALAGSANLI